MALAYGEIRMLTDVLLRVQDCKNIITSVLELMAGLVDRVIVIAGQGGATRPPYRR